MNVNCEDQYGRRPIHLAVSLQVLESVNILLEADCALYTPPSFRGLLQLALTICPGTNLTYTHRIATVVTRAIIDRHTRLNEFASTVLLNSPAEMLLSRCMLRESSAPLLIQEIRGLGYEVPAALLLDGKSVYATGDFDGSIRLTRQIADGLWDGGFRDFAGDDPHSSPYLQSWFAADFEMVQWFQSKGVRPGSTKHSLSGLHFYGDRHGSPGWIFGNDANEIPCNSELVAQLKQDKDLYHDLCSCLCSAGGCTPISKMVRSFMDPGRDCKTLGQNLAAWVKHAAISPEELHDCLCEALRAVFFQIFFDETDHTCCDIGYYGDIWIGSSTVQSEPEPSLADSDVSHREVNFRDSLEKGIQRLNICKCPISGKILCVIYWKGICRSDGSPSIEGDS